MDKSCPITPPRVEGRFTLENGRPEPWWPTLHTVGLGLGLCMLLGAGCATVRPNFQRTFRAGRTSHDLWMNLLTTRYGCDTVAVVANMPRDWNGVDLPPSTSEPGRRLQVRMDACTAASLVIPYEVAAWVGPEGIHEEWKYQVASQSISTSTNPIDTGVLHSLYLEGRNEKALRVVPPVPQPGP